MTEQEQQSLFDEFGDYHQKVTAHKPIAKKYEELKKKVLALHADKPAKQCEARGTVYRIDIGPCGNKREVTKKRALYRLWGLKRFLELCKVGVETCEANTEDPGKYIESTQTGPRSIDVVLIDAVEKKAA